MHHDLCFSPVAHLQVGLPHVRTISTRPPTIRGLSCISWVALERALRSLSGKAVRCFIVPPVLLSIYISDSERKINSLLNANLLQWGIKNNYRISQRISGVNKVAAELLCDIPDRACSIFLMHIWGLNWTWIHGIVITMTRKNVGLFTDTIQFLLNRNHQVF